MEAQPQLQPLYDILAHAQELMRLAEAGDWQALETGTEKFQQQVRVLDDVAFIESLVAANLVEPAKELIAQIQQLNDQLDTYATDMRGKISSELRQIIQADKALSAYGQ